MTGPRSSPASPRRRRCRHESGPAQPALDFEGSIYFGCHDPHLPLEHGYSKALLEARGHEVLPIDAHLMDLGLDEMRAELRAFGPEMTVVTTAPTYLFWRCPPPDPERRSLGGQARSRAERYSASRMTAGYLDAYAGLLGPQRDAAAPLVSGARA